MSTARGGKGGFEDKKRNFIEDYYNKIKNRNIYSQIWSPGHTACVGETETTQAVVFHQGQSMQMGGRWITLAFFPKICYDKGVFRTGRWFYPQAVIHRSNEKRRVGLFFSPFSQHESMRFNIHSLITNGGHFLGYDAAMGPGMSAFERRHDESDV
ncbi:MAG: hypothetical protein IJ157_03690 [Clostridia bacterium]|nr:hypothetical protein [Clostridia bacterium]